MLRIEWIQMSGMRSMTSKQSVDAVFVHKETMWGTLEMPHVCLTFNREAGCVLQVVLNPIIGV